MIDRRSSEYHVMKGIGPYDIHRPPALDEAMKLEIAFFVKHLKSAATAR